MLRTLVIRDFIIVDYQEISFAPGFNVITGETGTGKSLLVNALSFLLGLKGREEWIRPGSSKTLVEGLFSLEGMPELRERIAQLGIPLERESLVVLSRELARGGKSKARINGRNASLALLRDVAANLLDICGQREHSSFFTSGNVLQIIDYFLSPEGKKIKEEYRCHFEAVEALKEELLSLERGQEKEIEDIREVLEETESAGLTSENILRFEEEFSRVSQAQRYLEATQTFSEYTAGEEGMRRKISHLKMLFRGLKEDGGAFPVLPIVETLERVELELEEVALLVRRIEESFFFSPERVEEIEGKVAEIERLKRKYRFLTTREFVSFLEGLEGKKKTLEEEIRRKEQLKERLENLKKELMSLGEALSEERKKAFRILKEKIKEELKTLAFPSVAFDLLLRRRPNPGLQGLEEASFLVSLNPGMSLLPVEETASGGELSRIVLALKSIASALLGTPVLVFDEIDQGIGGVTALGVGDKLKKLAQTHQVVCITHLPQIASFADHHLKVEKYYAEDRVWARVVPLLSREERVREIARMMGDEREEASTLEYAEILMRRAHSGSPTAQ
ncbi:MAG: DNA repair protein RecN [Candidatus Caldatribacteriaceae bacterium]